MTDGSSEFDPSPGSSPAPEVDASRPRALLAAGAVTVAAGVALVGALHPDIGGVVLLVGWALLGGAIHAFGRGAAA